MPDFDGFGPEPDLAVPHGRGLASHRGEKAQGQVVDRLVALVLERLQHRGAARSRKAGHQNQAALRRYLGAIGRFGSAIGGSRRAGLAAGDGACGRHDLGLGPAPGPRTGLL